MLGRGRATSSTSVSSPAVCGQTSPRSAPAAAQQRSIRSATPRLILAAFVIPARLNSASMGTHWHEATPPLSRRRHRRGLCRRLHFCARRRNRHHRTRHASISQRRMLATDESRAGCSLFDRRPNTSTPAALRAPGALLSTRRIRVRTACATTPPTSNGWPSASRHCPPNGNSV